MSFAAEKNLVRTRRSISSCMRTAVGLFEMNWILICPVCSCVIDSFRALKNLRSHCRCTHCPSGFGGALDDMIAIAFTVTRHPPHRLSRSANAVGGGFLSLQVGE